MHHFQYKDGELHAEDVRVADLAAQYGTPLYVYSAATLRRHFEAFDSAFPDLEHLTCYSVKANSNLSVLRLLAEQGAGMDIVSGGELFRALKAGVNPQKIVYSGVGKRREEIDAALDADILMFNVESKGELELISRAAEAKGVTARISLRINPDVDPKTHPYISTGMKKNKFGLDMETSLSTYEHARDLPGLTPVGIDCHIGSQLTTIEPFLEALEKVLGFRDELAKIGIDIQYLDLGGGLGIQYDEEEPPHPKEFGAGADRAPEGPAAQGDLRARPRHRGQRGHAGDRGGLHQDHAQQAFRHCGRGHERPDPPVALRLVPSHRRGQGIRPPGARRGRGGPPSASPATSSPATVSSPTSNPATSWPASPPEPTASP